MANQNKRVENAECGCSPEPDCCESQQFIVPGQQDCCNDMGMKEEGSHYDESGKVKLQDD